MNHLKNILLIAAFMGSTHIYAQEEQIPYNQDDLEFQNEPNYSEEELTPEEQTERPIFQDDQEWEVGEPLPNDNQSINPTDEYYPF